MGDAADVALHDLVEDGASHVSSCNDPLKHQDETDIDCGGRTVGGVCQ
jgi:hypothetical protein